VKSRRIASPIGVHGLPGRAILEVLADFSTLDARPEAIFPAKNAS